MTKSFITNKPALNMTLVGCGQCGARIVDVFAKYQTSEGEQTYNCLALNSTEADFKELKFIDPSNRVSLALGGLGKNPEKASKILAKDERVKSVMRNFVSKKLRVKDDMLVVLAGLGGGTGTSTIVKLIEDFNELHNKPLIQKTLDKMIEKVGEEAYKQHEEEINQRAFKIAEEQFIKIGVIACLPLESEGPDVLRQATNFANSIWELANDSRSGIAFVMFPDNQFFYDKFKQLPQTVKEGFDNYRDYSNYEIANTLHEINTAASQGSTSIVMDSEDLKRALTERKGCLIISKQEVPSDVIESPSDITKLFEKTMKTSSMHDPIEIELDKGFAQVHHVGLLASIDSKKSYGNGSFMDSATELVYEHIPPTGTIFSGYVEEKSESTVTTYVFYKANALPKRLAKGLAQEYKEYISAIKGANFISAGIEKIEGNNLDILEEITLSDLGGDSLISAEPAKDEEESTDILAILDDFDFTF